VAFRTTIIKSCGFFAAAHEGEDAVVGVIGVDPLESRATRNRSRAATASAAVELVQVGYQALNPAMRIILKQVPVEAARFAEFTALGEFPGP